MRTCPYIEGCRRLRTWQFEPSGFAARQVLNRFDEANWPRTPLCYARAMPDPSAPLAGLVVLDFTRVLAGPYCTRLLADLGARVIKIERARGGDDMRKGHLQLEPGRDDQSTYFTCINVGKESLGLDLGRSESRAILLDLARVADVAV